jgi:hypothetical protein
MYQIIQKVKHFLIELCPPLKTRSRLSYCNHNKILNSENYLQNLKIGGDDTIGIFLKKYLLLFQYITKIQRSFSKI